MIMTIMMIVLSGNGTNNNDDNNTDNSDATKLRPTTLLQLYLSDGLIPP